MSEADPRLDQATLLAKQRTKLALDRNRLANERTYLAWLRTGLASVGGGVAIIRLISFATEQHRLIADITGAILILLGISFFLLAYFHYRHSYKQLESMGALPASLGPYLIITLVLCLVAVVLCIIAYR